MAVLMGVSGLASAGEVPIHKVPKPVMETVTTRFKDAKVIGSAEEKAENGNTVYEVSLDRHGRNIDVTLTPTGSLVSIEQEIVFKELPAAVASTLEKRYPKAKYKMVEEFYKMEKGKEVLAHYEALLMDANKHALSVEVAANGKVLNVEKKKSLEED